MYPRTFFEIKPPKIQTGKCFVIMPFADTFDEVYATIREAIEGPELRFACERAAELPGNGHLTQEVLRGIGEAEIIVADLTDKNADVFYQLGIAHMLKSMDKVILITQDMACVPFDASAFRCIAYTPTTAGARQLQADLVAAIRQVADLLIEATPGEYPIYRFRVHNQESYHFPRQLLGRDGSLYDFELLGDDIGEDRVRLRMQMTRHATGQPPERLGTQGYDMQPGEQAALLGIPWIITLESVGEETAVFRLAHTGQPREE
ncbi:MAG: hypothetical protein GX552_01395 [Chloroflexi bacterium]|nr:hypothetical protein [Chloroflexota bacterium]